MERSMWICPDCGREFLTANMWHSCTPGVGIEAFLAGRPEGVVTAFRHAEEIMREIGPMTVEPLKTRIGFKARTTFVSATFTRTTMRLGIVLARVVADPRLRVDSYGGRHVHTLEVTAPGDLDDQALLTLLREAYWLGTEGAGRQVD
jgi:hypothetical protein